MFINNNPITQDAENKLEMAYDCSIYKKASHI